VGGWAAGQLLTVDWNIGRGSRVGGRVQHGSAYSEYYVMKIMLDKNLVTTTLYNVKTL
jgi:hypothetical protein